MRYYALKDTKKGIKILFATDGKKELISKAKQLTKFGYVTIARSVGSAYNGKVRIYNWATKLRKIV